MFCYDAEMRDLENKLLDFRRYFNDHRSHTALEGQTPDQEGRSLQAQLKTILEAQAQLVSKAEARALAARIRRRIGSRPQTDSGALQAEGRMR